MSEYRWFMPNIQASKIWQSLYQHPSSTFGPFQKGPTIWKLHTVFISPWPLDPFVSSANPSPLMEGDWEWPWVTAVIIYTLVIIGRSVKFFGCSSLIIKDVIHHLTTWYMTVTYTNTIKPGMFLNHLPLVFQNIPQTFCFEQIFASPQRKGGCFSLVCQFFFHNQFPPPKKIQLTEKHTPPHFLGRHKNGGRKVSDNGTPTHPVPTDPPIHRSTTGSSKAKVVAF